jgi:hypothetical protein
MQLKDLIVYLQKIEDKTPNKEVFVQIYDKKRDEYEINKNDIVGEYENGLDHVMLYVTYNTGNVVLIVGPIKDEKVEIRLVDAKRLQDILLKLDNDATFENELAIIEEAEDIIGKAIYPTTYIVASKEVEKVEETA